MLRFRKILESKEFYLSAVEYIIIYIIFICYRYVFHNVIDIHLMLYLQNEIDGLWQFIFW